MDPVIVVATIRAKPGKEKEVQALLCGLLAPTHKEPGCLLYALHRRSDDPSAYVFVEKWRNSADLQAHLQSSHIRMAMARKEELLASIDIATLDSVPGGNREKSVI